MVGRRSKTATIGDMDGIFGPLIPRPPDAQLFLSLARKQFGVQQVLDAGGAGFAPDLARVAMRYALAHEHICDNKRESASACLMWDGRVVTWGYGRHGGDSALVHVQLTEVESISSTDEPLPPKQEKAR